LRALKQSSGGSIRAWKESFIKSYNYYLNKRAQIKKASRSLPFDKQF